MGIERLNVFDNDEFDVMTQDVIDPSKVHKGKRFAIISFVEFLIAHSLFFFYTNWLLLMNEINFFVFII